MYCGEEKTIPEDTVKLLMDLHFNLYQWLSADNIEFGLLLGQDTIM